VSEISAWRQNRRRQDRPLHAGLLAEILLELVLETSRRIQSGPQFRRCPERWLQTTNRSRAAPAAMLPARQNSSSSAGANCKLQKSAKGESKARRRRQTCAAHHAGGSALGSPIRPRLPAGCSKSR